MGIDLSMGVGITSPVVAVPPRGEAPELISDLKYWFRADSQCFTDLAATIQAADGESVRAITDRSGNSTEIFPVENDARRPTYRATSGINSVPSLEWDGVDDRFRLAGANAGDFEIDLNEAFSFFLVFNHDVLNKSFFEKDIGGAPSGVGWEFRTSLNDPLFNLYNVNGIDGVAPTTASDATPASQDTILILTKSTTPGEAGFSFYINSTTPDSSITSGYDNAVSTTVNTSDLLVGTRGNEYFTGHWPEWAFFKKELSVMEVSDLMTYAGDRYGITIS